jgi:folate-binding protein YgfZ
MIPDWHSFLETHGALIENGRVIHFGKPRDELHAAVSRTVVTDLSHYGLIAVNGADAQSFLQNQFANDVQQVTEQSSQLNAYCSPKGRVLALFRLFKRGDTYYLRLPRAVLEPTLKRLRMFVLRSQVTLTDASDSLVTMGISGPEAGAQLEKILSASPQSFDSSTQIDTPDGGRLTVICIRGPFPRFEISGELAAIKKLWLELEKNIRPAGSDPWTLLDIRSGIPGIHPATVDAFVPQMLNLQTFGAISFKKGCYPGQEIVARMHHLGTLKRRMYRAHVDAPTLPQPSDNCYTSESEQPVGQVVEACLAPEGGFELLAVLQIAHAQNNKVSLSSQQGPTLQLLESPYLHAHST